MTWAKGQSGNPAGRPKIVRELAAMAREEGPACIKRLREIRDQTENLNAAARATEILLDRGFGKAIQPIDTGASLLDLIDQADREVVERALAMFAEDPDGDPIRTETAH